MAKEMGTWEDFQAIASEYDVTAEFMVNHISPASEQFQDFLEHGWASKYADMFINWDTFWPAGEVLRGTCANVMLAGRTRSKCAAGCSMVDLSTYMQACAPMQLLLEFA